MTILPGGHCFHCHEDFTEYTSEHSKFCMKPNEPSTPCVSFDLNGRISGNTCKKRLKVGDKVDKLSGYSFPGTVVSVFKNSKSETRVVVEMDSYGLLHIFSESNLKKI